MNLLTCGVWIAVSLLVGLTIRVVVRRILAGNRELASLSSVKEFVDAMNREVYAGARELDAAEQALSVVERAGMREELKIAVAGIRLGASVEQATPRDPAWNRLFLVWSLAHKYGLAFGLLSDRLLDDLETRLAQRSTAYSAMAGARLTVIVLLILPAAAVAMGESTGMGSANFLLFNPVGSLLLLVGVFMACAGVWWTEALSVKALGGVGGRAGPRGEDPLEVACLLDVFSAGVVAGVPTSHAWAIASAHGPAEAMFVATLLKMGAGRRAWETLEKHELFGPVARQAAQQTRAGSELVRGIDKHTKRLRQTVKDSAVANAEKILVTIAAPLTLCFLPAFIVVGLIPLVIGLAGI